MASATPSDTDPDTIALRIKRKRSRRVSFADTEVTSVHVFRRDDDESSENTAPDSDTGASAVRFFKDVGGESDDFKDSDDDEDENDDESVSFLRPIGSPSPMSSATSFTGSASSNNEEEFFGPVSSNFIRPGLCDSAASDDFHETTMDTTAFSLHYRSIARSDSGGYMKTPSSFRLGFEERTLTHDPCESGSLMSVAEPKSLVPVGNVRGGEDLNDMSIVEGNSCKYDYGRLSPRLDAILAEGIKDLHTGSVQASISTAPSKGEVVAVLENNGTVHVDGRDDSSTEMNDFSTQGVISYPESTSHINLSEVNGLTAFDFLSNRSSNPSAGVCVDDQIQTSNQSIKVSNKLTEDKCQKGMEILESLAVNGHLLENGNGKTTKSLELDAYPLHDSAAEHLNPVMGKENSPSDRRYHSNMDPHSDKEESIHMLSANGQQSIMNTPNTARYSEAVTPSSKHEVWYPSIQKSISRLRIKDPSPRASSLKDEIQKLKHRLSSYSSPNAPLSTVMAAISKDLQRDFDKSPTFVEKQVGDPKKSGLKNLVNTGANDIVKQVEIQKLGKDENSTVTEKDEASMHHMFMETLLKDTFDRPVEEAALQFQSENNFQAGLDSQHNLAPVNSMKGHSQSPSRENRTPSPLLGNSTSSSLRNGPSPHKKEIARSVSKTKLCVSPSGKEGIGNPIEEEENHSLFVKELTPSPFRLSSTEQCINMPLLKYKESPELILNNHHNDYYQGLHISQSPLTTQDAESSFGCKRRNSVISLEDGNCMIKVPGSQRSSKVQRSENYDTQLILGHSTVLQSDSEKHGNDLGDPIWESWTDILVKFKGDSEQLLSPLTSNLTLKAIGVLEDILTHLAKVKEYEMLGAQNQSQAIRIGSGHKRVAEARLLLCRLAYEKARLQLMQLKRQKLQSKVQLLNSAVQEYQTLKFNFTQCQSEAGKKEIRVDERRCLVGEQEGPGDNVRALKHELKDSDGQIKTLSSFLNSHIKFKGEPSFGATISLAHDHLKTRTFCRLIRQELQSWDVDGFEIKNGRFNILLSHQGYISQRFCGNVGPTSCIIISKELNNVKIMKAFPNTGSLVAFGFVLESEVTKEIFDSRCLVQETQVIRLQLHNLLDVIEEVQLARFEIVNLIQTSFHTTSDDGLDLQLCFLDYKSSRKLTLFLDMTCLKRGVYPSEILPYQIQASESAAHVSLPQSVLADIRAAAKDLESGSTRIMRLCRCVSKLVQSS